jgi:hypothetical protein
MLTTKWGWYRNRLMPFRGASTNDNRVNVKLLRQLALPLVAKMRRAQNGDAASVAPLQKFVSDKGTFDGLPIPT